MNALFFSILASACASSSNLFFRKSSAQSVNESSAGYLLFFYFGSFMLSFVLNPFIFSDSLNLLMFGFGMGVGVLNMGLMYLTSRALKTGPAGLTFAFQNTSAVFPGIILYLIFGAEYGFTYSFTQMLGVLLVVYGLFIGARCKSINKTSETPTSSFKSSWIKYALACLGVQILALTLIQLRCIFFEYPGESLSHSFSLASREDVSFLIGQFGTAFLIQFICFVSQGITWPQKAAFYGSLGGVSNFLSTALLLLATKWALPFEQGILFPCFAVGTIILSNLWANRLYQEKFNILSNVICACGILMSLV